MTTQKTRSKNLSINRYFGSPQDFEVFTPEVSSRYFILRNKRKVVSSKGFDTYEQARQALRKVLRKTFQHLFLKSTGAYVGRANGQVSYGAKWTTNPCAFSHLGYTIQKR